MGVKEILNLCENERGIKFKVTNGDVAIATEVQGVKGNKIIFNEGYLELWENSEVKEKKQPANSIIDCNWCYSVSRGGKLFGYIYKPGSKWSMDINPN